MADRENDGKFKQGVSGNPNGRPKKEREVRYYEIMQTACSFSDWKEIVEKAVAQAKRGDAVARKWLSDNLMGVPIQRTEITGADGEKIVVRLVNDG